MVGKPGKAIILCITLTFLSACGGDRTESEQTGKVKINIPENLSPEMKTVLQKWTPYWEEEGFTGMPAPDDYEGWSSGNEAKQKVAKQVGAKVAEEFGIKVKERHIRGVRVLDIKPKNWKNKDKVLVHTHGGGFYAHSPDSAVILSFPLADKLGIRIISVDYTLMPKKDWSIQKQRDQIIDVYKSVIEDEGFKPNNVGAYGCSAGGALTLNFINQLSHQEYPVPGAAVLQAPMTDFTFDSDSYSTLADKDPVVSIDLWKNIR